jgi:hypothetical protein
MPDPTRKSETISRLNHHILAAILQRRHSTKMKRRPLSHPRNGFRSNFPYFKMAIGAKAKKVEGVSEIRNQKITVCVANFVLRFPLAVC